MAQIASWNRGGRQPALVSQLGGTRFALRMCDSFIRIHLGPCKPPSLLWLLQVLLHEPR